MLAEEPERLSGQARAVFAASAAVAARDSWAFLPIVCFGCFTVCMTVRDEGSVHHFQSSFHGDEEHYQHS